MKLTSIFRTYVMDGQILRVEPCFSTVEKAKHQLTLDARALASQLIMEVVPQYKQINAALGIYNDTNKQLISSVIKVVRAQCYAYENQIDACTTFEELDTIDFNYSC